jgi:hypothetical protein
MDSRYYDDACSIKTVLKTLLDIAKKADEVQKANHMTIQTLKPEERANKLIAIADRAPARRRRRQRALADFPGLAALEHSYRAAAARARGPPSRRPTMAITLALGE